VEKAITMFTCNTADSSSSTTKMQIMVFYDKG